MDKKQISGGIVLSYALIIINCVYGLFITPFILSCIGTSDYGVYKTIASFSASLAVIDLGIGSTVLRYVTYFYAEGDKKKVENYIAMAFMQCAIILVMLAVVSFVCYKFIPQFYSNKFSDAEIATAKTLFIVLAVNMGLHIIENIAFGVLSGCSKFVFGNGIKLMRMLMKVVLIFLLLGIFRTSVTIVLIDTLIAVTGLIIEGIYIVKKLEIRPKLYSFDKPVFMESLRYSMLMLVQTLVIQFNGHVDNILIGAYIGAASVSVYSIGLQLYNMFEQFAMAFSNLMLPTVTQQIVQNNTNTQLEDTVIKVGRFQFIFLGAVLCGFIILGKEFITLWVGEEFLDAWKVGVILMVPTMIPLIQNVCLAILRAKNKLAFRTTMVSVMAVINLVITYIGTKYFESYIYAAIGTAVSLVVANVIAMNIYYYAVLKINVFRIFKNVLSRNWLCVIVPTLAVLYIKKFFAVSILSFVTLIVIFVIIYAILLWFIGLNDSEKNMIKRIVKK